MPNITIDSLDRQNTPSGMELKQSDPFPNFPFTPIGTFIDMITGIDLDRSRFKGNMEVELFDDTGVSLDRVKERERGIGRIGCELTASTTTVILPRGGLDFAFWQLGTDKFSNGGHFEFNIGGLIGDDRTMTHILTAPQLEVTETYIKSGHLVFRYQVTVNA